MEECRIAFDRAQAFLNACQLLLIELNLTRVRVQEPLDQAGVVEHSRELLRCYKNLTHCLAEFFLACSTKVEDCYVLAAVDAQHRGDVPGDAPSALHAARKLGGKVYGRFTAELYVAWSIRESFERGPCSRDVFDQMLLGEVGWQVVCDGIAEVGTDFLKRVTIVFSGDGFENLNDQLDSIHNMLIKERSLVARTNLAPSVSAPDDSKNVAIQSKAVVEIPPNKRTRLLSGKEAAKFAGYDGAAKNAANWMSEQVANGMYRKQEKSRQSAFYHLDDFAEELHEELKPTHPK